MQNLNSTFWSWFSYINKFPCSLQVFLEPETLEQRVLAAAVPPEGMRFSFELNPEIGADREKAENSSTGDKVGIWIVILNYEVY